MKKKLLGLTTIIALMFITFMCKPVEAAYVSAPVDNLIKKGVEFYNSDNEKITTLQMENGETETVTAKIKFEYSAPSEGTISNMPIRFYISSSSSDIELIPTENGTLDGRSISGYNTDYEVIYDGGNHTDCYVCQTFQVKANANVSDATINLFVDVNLEGIEYSEGLYSLPVFAIEPERMADYTIDGEDGNSISFSNEEGKAFYNKYHEMLDKGFEVLNSVSKKCNDENAKTKGGIYYYKNKDNDYNKLIEAQKNWIDNLPENNTFSTNVQLQNTSPMNKTYQINDQLNNMLSNNKNRKTSSYNSNPYEQNKMIDSNSDQNRNELNDKKFQERKNNRLFFDSKRNNNKGYIIKKGEKINNNPYEGKETNDFKNNYSTDPNINNKSKSNPANSILSNQSNMNYNSFPQSDNKNYNIKKNNNNDNKDILINSEENKEDKKNPLNERYLIVDKDGNPILNNGKKIYGIELIPLIDEEGKEVIDDNGNIVLIGPNGDPKSQDELEPIIINNDLILVNEENKPFLGLDGAPLINNEGNPITGPDELLDKDNKKIKGIIGFVTKDNNPNPTKINTKENNKENEIKNNLYDYNKLKPLLGSDGKPILDSNNNFIILDQNNKPIENKDIKVLLSEDGTPVLNERGKPILTDKDEKPLNSDDMNDIEIKHFRKKRDKIKNKRKNKKERNVINYSECNPESLKKINFIRPYKNPFYDDIEYKGSCFACDVGCSVSKSGYSIMNYSPYNNLIRRRNTTPIKIVNDNDKRYKRNSKKNEKPNYKRYYLV